jgi:hypothetical protein
MSHPLKAAPGAPAWPSYRGTAELVGKSPSGTVTVYVDPSLGAQARQNATELMDGADSVVQQNNGFFGTAGDPVDVIVFAIGGATDGTGGADHAACNFQTGNAIEVCASYGQPERVLALFEAELSECSMGGNLCGVSTGEALSRWCAMITSNNALSDFATAPQWAADGYPDWVTQTDPTDQDADSIGCGMAFISWLLHNGTTFDEVARGLVSLGGDGTFEQLYGDLVPGGANPWSTFLSDVQAIPGGVSTDDPFGAAPG